MHSFPVPRGKTSADFEVSLTVTSPKGRSMTTSHPINAQAHAAVQKPAAAFKIIETKFKAGDTLHLVDESSGQIDSWTWRVNGQIVSEKQNPELILRPPAGAQKISLTVDGPGGQAVSPDREIQVAPRYEPAKIVRAGISRASGKAPLTVRFDAAGEGDIRDIQWVFGDGESSVAPKGEHQYTSPGEYVIRFHMTPADPEAAPVSWESRVAVKAPWPRGKKMAFWGAILLPFIIAALVRWRRHRRQKLRLVVYYYPEDSYSQNVIFTCANETLSLPGASLDLLRESGGSTLTAKTTNGARILEIGREDETREISGTQTLTIKLSQSQHKNITVSVGKAIAAPPSPAQQPTPPPATHPPDDDDDDDDKDRGTSGDSDDY